MPKGENSILKKEKNLDKEIITYISLILKYGRSDITLVQKYIYVCMADIEILILISEQARMSISF